MRRIARFIYAWSTPIIILVASLNIVALVSLFRFELDTDFLNFFTSGNPRAEEFDRLKEKYETGEQIPSTQTLLKLSTVLDIPASELLDHANQANDTMMNHPI